MKKLLALLLTGAMAVGMLAGCGSSDLRENRCFGRNRT